MEMFDKNLEIVSTKNMGNENFQTLVAFVLQRDLGDFFFNAKETSRGE